ncbi:MAG: phosphoribosylformylglycinamidine synthase II, partial [Thermoleophilia bacterium]
AEAAGPAAPAAAAAAATPAEAPTPAAAARPDLELFGEAPTRVVVSVAPAVSPAFQKLCEGAGVPTTELGTVGGDALHMLVGGCEVNVPLASLREAFEGGIRRALGVE